ncbi:MAG: cation:proton antiporter subunit C [Nitrospirota bacterium]|jgi:multicomponent Na+:H+ antiporter subunit C
MEFVLAKYNYWIYITLMMIGFYAMIAGNNLIKKVIGMNIFQTAVFLFYISIGKVDGGTAPIVWEGATRYENPLPHVLILTAIVVSVSTTAVAFALISNIYKEFGTIEEDKIIELKKKAAEEARR